MAWYYRAKGFFWFSARSDYIGEISSNEIASYFSRTSLTVIPSRFESYGIVVVEAICSGSPVVATEVGGIPEIVKLFQKNVR